MDGCALGQYGMGAQLMPFVRRSATILLVGIAASLLIGCGSAPDPKEEAAKLKRSQTAQPKAKVPDDMKD